MNENSTVLVVDDDSGGREAICSVLLSQGYELLEADNGMTALELAQNYIPDLILLDVMMPGMDGFQVCQQLRSDPLLHEIPILMVTALDDRESRIRGIEVGADDFISKPYDRIELRARVRTITRLNRYRHLLLERARFVWVIENDQDGYLILDENESIKFANASARRLLNLPNDETEQAAISFFQRIQNQFMCVPPNRWSTWPEIDHPEAPLYLIHQQDEDNRKLWFEVQILDLPWVTKKQRLLRIKDITQTMALTLETWSFQSAARHKFLTPLTNIIFSLQVVRKMTAENGSEDLQECINSVESGARRLESEIKDVLQYIYAPMLAGPGEKFALSGLRALAAKTAGELGVEKMAFPAIDPALEQACIPLSGRAVQIILWELLENAKKFHPQLDPQVDLQVTGDSPGKIMLRIRDNGSCIPPEHLNQVLVPYYQGEKTYTGEVKGMGLGLSTVAAFIWQIGGEISLYNRRDIPGVIVEINLPIV